MPRFISEEIEVHFAQQLGPPTSFTWREKTYAIKRVVEHHGVLDFQKSWYRRKHRDWYVVETEEGEYYKFYRHRGPGRSYWVLYEQLEADEL